MKKNQVILWISGSYGSGKTTQSKAVVEGLKDEEDEVLLEQGEENGVHWMYTNYGDTIAVIGKVGRNQCTGLDTVYSKLKKEGITLSLHKALDSGIRVILVECIFATHAWYRHWHENGVMDRAKILAVHLELNLWNNYKRIAERRARKNNLPVEDWYKIELPDSVYKNTGAKNLETRTIWQKVDGSHPKQKPEDPIADFTVQIDALRNPKDITEEIYKNLSKSLL